VSRIMQYDEKKAEVLESIIDEFPEHLFPPEIKNSIMQAYRFRKPLTSIEIDGVRDGMVNDFKRELDGFFLVECIEDEKKSETSLFSGNIFISRYKHVFDFAIKLFREYGGKLDQVADLFGILFGYPAEEVARYCLTERMSKLELIK